MMVILVIYALLSLVGMAAVWTVAAKRGIVRHPNFFFWMRAHEIQPQADALLCDERSNTCSPGFAMVATAIVAVTIASTPPMMNRSVAFQSRASAPNELRSLSGSTT